MSEHALLSPSGAYRWLNCTPAPRLEAELPDKTSMYAEEGTLAHSVCEVTAKKLFKKIQPAEYTRAIEKFKTSSLWDDEMLHTAETYVEHLTERAMNFEREPYVTFEVKTDLADYVPESFGRCDCVMFGEETLIITDYKHGKGIPISAKENPQMMLYALGALKLYQPIFGNAVKKIEMCIDQPRLNSYEIWSCSIDELLAWGESIFCRANGRCRAQTISAFEDFSEIVNRPPALLSAEETGNFLKKGETLTAWYEALKQSAFEKLMSGCKIPGYKIVECRSSRTWTNQDAAFEKLQAAGIEHAIIYDSVPKTLAKLEKMLGVAKFKELVGEFVVKHQGKPTLATADDKREEFSDFKKV